METPIKTPNSSVHYQSDNVLSTPLFVPPTPMLKELGYGTGKLEKRSKISILIKSLQWN